MCIATSFTRSVKISLRATKSVSQLISTKTPIRPSWLYVPTSPARASRSPRLSALVIPFLRIASRALSKSPFASSNACLASVRPTPVRFFSLFMSSIDTAIYFSFLCAMILRVIVCPNFLDISPPY